MKVKVVRDPVHGHIRLGKLALALMDTWEMQRLRWVRQLGLSNLVYPGANHSRFEHSLGVYHLACQLASTLDLAEEITAAALLHDIGHGPLSHATEALIQRYTRKSHTQIVEDILKNGEIAAVLEDLDLSPRKLTEHIQGKTRAGQILNSEIDVDRMDYLVRDSHYTGVAYGIFDYIRLIHELHFHGDSLVVGEGGIQAVESLLVSRFLMYPTVYYHHVSRIAETMCTRALEEMIETGELEASQLRKMDDLQLFTALLNASGYPHEIGRRLKERRLFKRAIYTSPESIKINRNPRHIEEEIAGACDIDPKYVLVDLPTTAPLPELKAKVKINNNIIPLKKASQLLATLSQAQKHNWRLGVYTPKEYREKVKKHAKKYFNIQESRQTALGEIKYH